jgi:pimeloyl-ACP methyl ester carboxylesterase
VSFTAAHRGGDGAPLLLLHGFTDTWRTWEPVLPLLEERFEVLAPTLAGHAGGPPLGADVSDTALVDAVEAALDEVGWEAPAIAGNSLGGYVGLHLAARGRARSVVALAPAGGWEPDDPASAATLRYFKLMQRLVRDAAPRADEIASTPEGRARSTAAYASTAEHLSPDLVAHLIRGSAGCEGGAALIDFAEREGWDLDPSKITCPVRLVWGTADRILPLPGAAKRFRDDWFPTADWIEIDGAGHALQLDRPAEIAALITDFSA